LQAGGDDAFGLTDESAETARWQWKHSTLVAPNGFPSPSLIEYLSSLTSDTRMSPSYGVFHVSKLSLFWINNIRIAP
jgi:hypothetical protein